MQRMMGTKMDRKDVDGVGVGTVMMMESLGSMEDEFVLRNYESVLLGCYGLLWRLTTVGASLQG